MALLNFDSSKVEPAKAFEVIPAGTYTARITASTMKPTKNGLGQYLELQFQIIEGPHAKRVLFDRLNLKNSNEQTVRIAQEQLSAICHATGVLRVSDSQQLHGIPLKVKVGIRKDPGYDETNEIKGYMKADNPSNTFDHPPAEDQAGEELPPWLK